MIEETMTCQRCGHKWPPKVARPKKCPRCQCRFDWGRWKLKKGGV